jgi:protein-S-isoprenylcysteine O-methyltransferase Ste14
VALILWMIRYWAWIVSEVVVIVLTRTRKSSGAVRDRGSIFVLWIAITCAIAAGSWYGEVHPHTIFGGAHWVRTGSVAILAAGLAIRWTSIVSLGRAFSVNVAIRADQKLYRRGLFAVVRHPSYTGMMIIFAAIGVRTRNWMALAILVIPTFAALLYRMRVEEAALGQAFGQDYEEYSKTTKRLVPGIY